MKITTFGELRFNKKTQCFETIAGTEKYYFYNGKISHAGGGGQSGGGGGSSTTSGNTSTQSVLSEPWSAIKGPAENAIANASYFFLPEPGSGSGLPAGGMPQYYTGKLTPDFAAETTQGFDAITKRATEGSGVQRAGNSELLKTLQGGYLDTPTIRGDYLYGGEGFNAAVDAATRKIIPTLSSTFNNGGRGSSGLAQQAIAQALSDSFAGRYGEERSLQEQAYARERANMQTGIQIAPTIAAADYNDAQALLGVGSTKEAHDYALNQEAKAKWDYEQNFQRNNALQYLAALSGASANFGGGQQYTTTTNSPQSTYTSSSAGGPGFSGILGKTASGAASGAMVGGPWGAVAGAGLGLVGGLL